MRFHDIHVYIYGSWNMITCRSTEIVRGKSTRNKEKWNISLLNWMIIESRIEAKTGSGILFMNFEWPKGEFLLWEVNMVRLTSPVMINTSSEYYAVIPDGILTYKFLFSSYQFSDLGYSARAIKLYNFYFLQKSFMDICFRVSSQNSFIDEFKTP